MAQMGLYDQTETDPTGVYRIFLVHHKKHGFFQPGPSLFGFLGSVVAEKSCKFLQVVAVAVQEMILGAFLV